MLNAADIVILAVLALSVLFGLWRGLVGEVLALATWIAAFWVAWVVGQRVAAFYAPWLAEPTARAVAGYLTCFLGVLIIGAVVSWIARRLLGAGGLRGGDRILGALFGLARGLLVVTFAVVILGTTALPREAAWWRTSTLLPPFESGARWLAAQLPSALDQQLAPARAGLPAVPRTPISAGHHATRLAPVPERATPHVRSRNDVGQ